MLKKPLAMAKMLFTDLPSENILLVIEQLKHAKSFIAFYQVNEEESKMFFSNLKQAEFNMLVNLIHRNTDVFEFIKLVIIGIETMRKGDLEYDQFLLDATEYIKKKTV